MTAAQSAQLKKAFLDTFRKHGNISRACDKLHFERRRVYDWKETDPKFAAAFEEAELEAVNRIEEEMYRRAVEGTVKPIYQGGKKVGVVREFSDTLLIFMLKSLDPKKYRDNVRVELVTAADIERAASEHGVEAGEVAALAELIANGKA